MHACLLDFHLSKGKEYRNKEKKFSEINVHNQEDGRSVKDICKWSWKFNEIYAI